jgi:8-amino-7-oxononanoate synthase
MNWLQYLEHKLRAQEAAGLLRAGPVRSGPARARTTIDGGRFVYWGSNHYLDLATHPEVVHAAQEAAARYGTGSGASPLLPGKTPLHEELEEELARWKGTEAACLFATGYQANVGWLMALCGPRDLVLYDELVHASLLDGARASGAHLCPFRHADPGSLEDRLRQERGRYRFAAILTDGVFSMDGDLAPLPDLLELAERFDALLFVDDAHGTGVLGFDGSGTAAHFGLKGRERLIHIGTTSKALAAEGGFLAGPAVLIRFLRNRARSYMFSTAPAPPVVAAALAALRIARFDHSRRQHLHRLGQRLRQGLRQLGWSVPDDPTPIVPLRIGPVSETLQRAEALRARGHWVPAIRPPTVPHGTSRLRLSLTAGHKAEEIDELLEALGPPPAGAGR